MCVCERVGDRELECGDYFTVAQLGCRVLMYFSRAQLCVEAVVGFRGRRGGGQILGQIWTDNPVGVKLDAGL